MVEPKAKPTTAKIMAKIMAKSVQSQPETPMLLVSGLKRNSPPIQYGDNKVDVIILPPYGKRIVKFPSKLPKDLPNRIRLLGLPKETKK